MRNIDEILTELKKLLESDLSMDEVHQAEDFVKEHFNEDGSLAITLQD